MPAFPRSGSTASGTPWRRSPSTPGSTCSTSRRSSATPLPQSPSASTNTPAPSARPRRSNGSDPPSSTPDLPPMGRQLGKQAPGALSRSPGRCNVSAGRRVSEGGFEPPRPRRALGPQPSASTKFRHSDVDESVLPTARGCRGRLFQRHASQNVQSPNSTAVATVMRSRLRSMAVPAAQAAAAAEHVGQATPPSRVQQDGV